MSLSSQLKGFLETCVWALGCLLLSFCFQQWEIVRSFELRTIDWRFRERPVAPEKLAPELTIVGISDSAQQELGRWPWPRALQARFLSEIQPLRPAAVAYDVLFVEADKSNPLSDEAFATVLRQSRNVILGCVGVVEIRNEDDSWGEDFPLPPFQAQYGLVGMPRDEDGVVRKVPMVREFKGKKYYGLALVAVADYLGTPLEEIQWTRGADIQLKSRDGQLYRIPVDSDGSYMVNFRGKFGTYRTVDASRKMVNRPYFFWWSFHCFSRSI